MRSFLLGLVAATLSVGVAPALPASGQVGPVSFGQSEPAVAVGYLAPAPLAYVPYAYYPVASPTGPLAYPVGWRYLLPDWPANPSPAAQADAASLEGLLPGPGSSPCALSSRWSPC